VLEELALMLTKVGACVERIALDGELGLASIKRPFSAGAEVSNLRSGMLDLRLEI
jgi:hypothetical protein